MILTLGEIKAAIIFQIWRNSVSRRFTSFSIRVIAESGLLYTLTSIAVVCVSLKSSNGYTITTAIVCHL